MKLGYFKEEEIMRMSALLLLMLPVLVFPPVVQAQDAEAKQKSKTPPKETPLAVGPKVHTSKAKDVTDCSNTTGGALVGSAVLASTHVSDKLGVDPMVAAAMTGEAADHAVRQQRCAPRAEVEDGDVKPEAEAKESKLKSGFKRLKGALGY